MTQDPHWTTYLSALSIPVVAIFTIFIACMQWRLAQNKLKLDLFDRRFTVYQAARTLLASIATSGKAKDEEILKFMIATREAKWLLNKSVAEYLEKQLYYKAIDLKTRDDELEGILVDEERTKNIHAQAKIKKWFMAQYDVLDEMFSPFLKLKH